MTAKHRAPSRPKQKSRLSKARKKSFMNSVPLLVSKAALLAGPVWGGSTLVISIAGKQELTQSGVHASATVSKHYKKTAPSSRTKSVYSLIDYTFTPGHLAEEHATGVELPSDLWNTVEAGSTRAVTYNPTSPSTNQPTMIFNRLSPTAASSIRLLVSVLLLVLFTWLSYSWLMADMSRQPKPKAIDPGTHVTVTGPAQSHGQSGMYRRHGRHGPRSACWRFWRSSPWRYWQGSWAGLGSVWNSSAHSSWICCSETHRVPSNGHHFRGRRDPTGGDSLAFASRLAMSDANPLTWFSVPGFRPC
ncbi:hypothetical protein [Arthrobacter sp. UCD-GKA]|uniref:hypothetical protein n=1 Tax=Arthrobacter sp. UCD-GKA TaxID=1913576 RepID=UPI001113BFE3|nr:hypothetical protein [Arthrobacter sp. UCD-GKA]